MNAAARAASIHACRGANDATADGGEGNAEKEIPVRAAFHPPLNLLDSVTLLDPKEGMPVVATFFQLWFRFATCVVFALIWLGICVFLFRAVELPPALLDPPYLHDLHKTAGTWKGPLFWSFLPALLFAGAIFGKDIVLPMPAPAGPEPRHRRRAAARWPRRRKRHPEDRRRSGLPPAPV